MGNNGIIGINSPTHCTVKKKSFPKYSAHLSSYKQKTNKQKKNVVKLRQSGKLLFSKVYRRFF